MIMNNATKNALKGFLSNIMYDIKTKLIFIGFLGCFIVIISLSNLLISGSSGDTGDVLSYGTMIVFIALCLWKFILTRDKEIFKKFVFPITRRVYSIGMFIYIIFEAFVALAIVSAIQIIELIFAMIIEQVSSNFYIVSTMTIEDYLVDFWVTFCFLVFFSSFSYFLGMFFHREKTQSITVIILIVSLPFIPFFKRLWDAYIYTEESIGVLSLKLLLLSVIFNLIAYLPLKRMEIKNG